MKWHRCVIYLLFVLSACSDDDNAGGKKPEWKKLGLDGKTINELYLSGSALYAGTTSGFFRKDMNSASDFQLIGFEGKNVEAIDVSSADEMLVSIFDKSGAEPPALYTTTDGGSSWQVLDNDFGGDYSAPVLDLERHPEDEQVVYATGHAVVGKSTNSGGSWQPIWGDWGGIGTGVSVVEVNPHLTDEVWAGGQGPIENGFLLRSQNESDWDRWNDLVENPTVVKEITFSPADAERLLVGFEGALLKTDDGGLTWETLIESEENRFYFGAGWSEANPNRIYAGGWLKTNAQQPLILFISNDGGTTWNQLTYPGESFGGIMELQLREEEDRDIVYLGLDKGGVYRVILPRD